MNKLKTFFAAAALSATGLASAEATVDFGQFTVTYDDTTPFGLVQAVNTGKAGVYSFEWAASKEVSFVHNGGPEGYAKFALPSFTLKPKAGFALAGNLNAYLGNIVYSEFNGYTTGYADGVVSLKDQGNMMFWWPLNKSDSSPNSGYFFGSGFTFSLDGTDSVKFSDASLNFYASGHSFVTVTGQPQNRLTFQFGVSAVPEPETLMLLLAGLGVVGFTARRRRAN